MEMYASIVRVAMLIYFLQWGGFNRSRTHVLSSTNSGPEGTIFGASGRRAPVDSQRELKLRARLNRRL